MSVPLLASSDHIWDLLSTVNGKTKQIPRIFIFTSY